MSIFGREENNLRVFSELQTTVMEITETADEQVVNRI